MGKELLVSLVDMARLTPSGRNAQSLKYAVIDSPERCAEVFPVLAWAGYLADWAGPEEGERPSAYIIICNDKDMPQGTLANDVGISAQTILLGAVEAGLGGCMIGSFRKKELCGVMSFPENIEPVLVVAIGCPKEKVVVTEVRGGDIKYYRDGDGTHYVPKRSLDEILIK